VGSLKKERTKRQSVVMYYEKINNLAVGRGDMASAFLELDHFPCLSPCEHLRAKKWTHIDLRQRMSKNRTV
jgi:hypothetical protein